MADFSFSNTVFRVAKATFLLAGIHYILIKPIISFLRLKNVRGPTLAAWTNIPHLSWVRTGRAHEIHRQLHDQYGPLVRIGPGTVSVDDVAAIPVIYPTKPGFPKGDFYQTLKPYSKSQGSIPVVFPTQDEKLHLRIKKPIAPMYSMSSAAALEPLIDSVLDVFLKQLEVRFASKCQEMDLGFWLTALAFDTMGTITFSKGYGMLERGEDVLGLEASIWQFMVKASPMTQMPWLDKVLYKNPVAAWFQPPSSTPILKIVAEHIAAREGKATSGLVKSSGASDINTGPKEIDMLDRFLRLSREQHTIPKWAPTSWTFSNVLAGSDSAAMVLSAIWHGLLTEPYSLERLESEVLSVCDLARPLPSWSQVKDLKYLDACVWEGLRMHPPFALVFERIVPKPGLQVCGSFLPEGTAVGMNPWVVNHNKNVFGEDVYHWRPERWLEGDAAFKKFLQSSVMTFGSGRRMCMGQNIALVEMKKSIAALVVNYEVSLGPSTNWITENRWFLRNDGLHAYLKRRAQ